MRFIRLPSTGGTGLTRGMQRVAAELVAIENQAHQVDADEFLLRVTRQSAGRLVGDAHCSTRRRDEHRIVHAVEHAIQVIACVGRVPQRYSHILKGVLELAESIAPRADECTSVLAAADLLGGAD